MPPKNSSNREEYLKKKRARKRMHFFLGIFVFIFIISILSFISYRPALRISKVELSGGVLVSQTDVESNVLKFLDGSYFWLFPKNNSIIYPKTKLEKYLTTSFPRIETINIDLQNFHTLKIIITEHKQDALWCDTLPSQSAFDTGSPEHCYFMNSNGLIFSTAPNFSGDAYFKYYGLLSTDEPIGKFYIASSTEFSDITDFISTIRKFSLRPQYLLASGDDQYTLFLSGNGKIYFDTKTPLSTVAQNLSALLRTTAFASTSSQNLPIEYIDLRFGNKLFYKLK